jgi:hypothetical protein
LQGACGVAIDQGDLDPIRAADQRNESPGHALGIGPDHAFNPMAEDLDRPPRRLDRAQPVSRDVGDQVAERVEKNDLADQPLFVLDRLERREDHDVVEPRPEFRGIAPSEQVGGGGGQDIATVKGWRNRRSTQIRVANLPDRRRVAPSEDVTDQAIVGNHEPVAPDLDGDQATVGPHAGVDHGQVDRPDREEVDDPGQDERPLGDVLGSDRVADVDHLGSRSQAQDHPLDRGHIRPIGTEIGRQRQDPGGHGRFSSIVWRHLGKS